MTPSRTAGWVVVVGFVAALGAACASVGRSPSISQVQTNPGRYVDHTVVVSGVVTNAFGIPLVPYKVYRVSDGTGEITVLSEGRRMPTKGARVRVRGEVKEFAVVGGRSLGLHLKEKSIKFE